MQNPLPTDSVTNLITWGSAFASVTVLQLIKTKTDWMDGKIGAVLKPIQPVIAMAASLIFPWIAVHTGIVADPQSFAAAPTATIAAVAAAEALKALKKKLGDK